MKILLNCIQPVVKFSKFLFKPINFPVKKFSRNFSIVKFEEQKNQVNNSWGSKKSHRKIQLQLLDFLKMADSKTEEILAPLRQAVKEQVILAQLLRLGNFRNFIFLMKICPVFSRETWCVN